jgi:hypothetical protein
LVKSILLKRYIAFYFISPRIPPIYLIAAKKFNHWQITAQFNYALPDGIGLLAMPHYSIINHTMN